MRKEGSPMWTAMDAERHAKGYVSEAREWDEWMLEFGLINEKGEWLVPEPPTPKTGKEKES